MTGSGGTSTAIAQDWFLPPGGSELVALELARLMPSADVYTSFADDTTRAALGSRLRTWPLQWLLGPSRSFRRLLPLYAWWFGRLNLRSYRLVVSSSVAFTHAVQTASNATHVSYVHTPMRYAWDVDSYLAGSSFGRLSMLGARLVAPWLRRWDLQTAKRPNVLVTNSETVRRRIQRQWNREAEVIYPPVGVEQIAVSHRDEAYLLVVARLLNYRRADLAIAAANAKSRALVIVGDGPERARLERQAGPTVRFVGQVDHRRLRELVAGCHAFVVPGIEDFGIAPVEAMAAGKPVIGFREGGVGETVIDGVTGVLFDRQDVDSVVAAIERLDTISFDPAVIRRRAEEFSTEVFRAKWRALFQRLGVDPSLYAAD